MDINPGLNMHFQESSTFQKGVISEKYQIPDMSFFQESQELESLISTGKLVQKWH